LGILQKTGIISLDYNAAPHNNELKLPTQYFGWSTYLATEHE